jgi:hypothetical protein
VCLACGVTPALGQEPPPPEPTPAARLVTVKGSVEWMNAIRWLDPARGTNNPGNATLRVPQFWVQTELRPDGRLTVGPRFTAVARPRLLAVASATWVDGLERFDSQDATANWTELYTNWRPNDVLQLTYGLQNFQWGPAELLAPSNRIFHETGIFRDAIYYVRGKHLVRVNLSVGKEWSFVALAELSDNGEPEFNAGEQFRRQGLAKLEYTMPSGAGYVGFTGGVRQGSRPWFGEYFSVAATEGFSAYLDAAHVRTNRAWYPLQAGPGGTFVRRDTHADAWRTLGVAGLRYTFASGVDFRGEYMHQDAGYSESDMVTAATASVTAPTPATIAAYLAPGLELLSRRLTLLSARMPDLPPAKHLVVSMRYLRSLTDTSGVFFSTMTLETTDSLVLFASATVTHGDDPGEFSRLARGSVVAGSVWTW